MLVSNTCKLAYIPSKISLRIGQVWVAWEGHQEELLSGDPWGGGVEQLVLVCEGEENECISEMYCTSLVRRSRKVTTRYKHQYTVVLSQFLLTEMKKWASAVS